MMREQSIASAQSAYDQNQKMSNIPSIIGKAAKDSFDKLVNSDTLIYLPNLYHRQFKMVDELIRLRQEFPEQKILLPRKHTSWDYLIDQMKVQAKVVNEVKKFKIAEKSHVSRQAKLQFQRQTLRAEEQQQFHRIIGSVLSQSVLEHWKTQKQNQMVSEPQQPVKKQEEQPRSHMIKVRQDDIFVDGDDDYPIQQEENDLLDDLLNAPVIEKKEEDIPNEQINIVSVGDYMAEQYRHHQQSIQVQPIYALSRRSAFKKINQSVRKRLKIKEEDEEQIGRSLSSATVLLSNIQKLDMQCSAKYLIDPPPSNQWHFEVDRQKAEDKFQLKWSPQQLEKSGLRKGKIESNLLAISLVSEEKDYEKIFEKNIANDRSFPPSIKNIPTLQVKHPKRYYNEFSDPEYQEFIMRYNKRNIFNEFTSKAAMIFPENYSHDDVDESESITSGKIFVHPPSKVLEKLVYRVSNYKLTVGVKNNLNSFNIDFNRMVIMAFLVKKYISHFGNAWNNVAQFVTMHPIFTNHHITPQLVQQVYQIISKFENQDRLKEIQLWDKKVLPFDSYGSQNLYREESKAEEMIPQESTSEDEDFDFNSYSKLIRKNHCEEDQIQNQLEKQYAKYAKKIKENALGMNLQNYAEELREQYSKICRIKDKFKANPEPIPYNPDFKAEQDVGKIREQLLATLKGQIKVGTPFRKKKNINEKNNELVKILQALRNKNMPPQGPPLNKPDYPKNMNPPKPIPPPIVKEENKETATQARKVVQASPDNKKRLGGPSKKDKKNKDNEDKK